MFPAPPISPAVGGPLENLEGLGALLYLSLDLDFLCLLFLSFFLDRDLDLDFAILVDLIFYFCKLIKI